MRSVFSVPLVKGQLQLPDLSDYQTDGVTLRDGCGYCLMEEWQPEMKTIKVLVDTSADIIATLKDTKGFKHVEDLPEPEPEPVDAATVAKVREVLDTFKAVKEYPEIVKAMDMKLGVKKPIEPIEPVVVRHNKKLVSKKTNT